MNPRVAEIPPSLIRSIAARKRAGDIDLGLGEPTLAPDIAPFESAVEWTRRHGSPYSPNAGFSELREAIAEYLSLYDGPEMGPGVGNRSQGTRVHGGHSGSAGEDHDHDSGERPAGGAHGERRPILSAANVCVTVGSEEALYLAIKAVVDPARHEVLIVEPCYLAYPKLCMLEGIRHRMIPLSPDNGFVPDATKVLSQVTDATRLIILNTPSNPTGRVWPAEELKALAEGLARPDREPIYVLADEVYRELYFGESAPASIAWWHPHTLIAGSLSKSSALTGLRLGWLAGPEGVIAAATKIHQFVNTAASTFSQRVAIELLSDPVALGSHRDRYREARRRLLQEVEAQELTIIPPEGAFYGFIRLPPPHAADSLRFAECLLDEQRVVSVPGRAFGESGEGWLRISWVAPPEAVEEGLRRIARALRSS